MKKTTDMTQGKPLGLLLGFAAPLMVGSVCQLLYTMADSAVVGRLLGVDAFAAVGAAGFLSMLLFCIISGLIQGFTILFAQLFGKKQWETLRGTIAMAALLSAGIGVLLTLLGLFCAEPVLALTKTPEDIRPQALVYVQWIFAGTLITMANRLSGMLLHALGNSRAPVTGSIASCVLNVALDLLFAGVFHWGVAGVAAATVLAQLASCGYCLVQLRAIPQARLSRQDFAAKPALLRELMRLGGPFALRDGVIAIGGLFVQAAINSYGKLFVAGMAAAEKYFGLLNITGNALEGAFSTYAAQNYGAGRMDRMQEGLRCSIRLALISAGIMDVLVLVLGRQLIGLLVSGEPQEVQAITQAGYTYLLVMALLIPLMFLLCLYRSGLQGMGSTFAPTLSGFVELGLRLLSVLLLPGLLGRWAVYLANPLGWLGAMLLLGISYHKVYKKQAQALGAEKKQFN